MKELFEFMLRQNDILIDEYLAMPDGNNKKIILNELEELTQQMIDVCSPPESRM